MTQAKPRFSSFEDYLAYDDGTEKLYELRDGELIELPPESGRNHIISTFLLLQLAPLIDFRRLRGHGLELEVRGQPQNRYPDLTVLREEHVELLERRNTIQLSMPPPLLVVEIVSPGETNRSRDYRDKRQQYQDLGIPEYWIVDPQDCVVLVLVLENSVYQELGAFRRNELIRSLLFPSLLLTPEQIFVV